MSASSPHVAPHLASLPCRKMMNISAGDDTANDMVIATLDYPYILEASVHAPPLRPTLHAREQRRHPREKG